HTLAVLPGQPYVRLLLELRQRPELDRLGRARFRASRLESTPQAVVAQRALVSGARLSVHADYAVRTRRDAVAAAVAHVLLDEDGVELGADDGAGRTDLHAAGLLAVLADVRHHQPGGAVARGRGLIGHVLDELDVAPVLGV